MTAVTDEQVDLSGLERHESQFFEETRKQLREYARRIQVEMAESIRSHIDPQRRPVGDRSSSGRIGSVPGSGGIWDALTVGDPGNLYSEIVSEDALDTQYGISGARIPWAMIQEVGGTISPSQAKALTIPVSEQAAAALKAADGNIRSLDLVLIKREGRTPILAKKVGDTLETWFVLATRVTLPARRYVAPGIETFATQQLPKITTDIAQDLGRIWDAI